MKIPTVETIAEALRYARRHGYLDNVIAITSDDSTSDTSNNESVVVLQLPLDTNTDEYTNICLRFTVEVESNSDDEWDDAND